MIKIGITGQFGFLGKHIYNTLGLFPEKYARVEFRREFFDDEARLDNFVAQCDVIIHTAALNRHNDPEHIYEVNVGLVDKLIASFERTGATPHVLFSSSLQEEKDNLYGKSKKEGRVKFIDWADKNNALFTGLIIPNVFGPFGHPYYNSVVATFSHQLSHGEIPEIHVDGDLKLIYVSELVRVFLEHIEKKKSDFELQVPHTKEIKVSEILSRLRIFKDLYQDKGIIPELTGNFDVNLFNTFRCYMDIKHHFPVKYTQHTDNRGAFVEVIRLNVGGQVSFSTTVPGIVRGNHFHTRKIERFSVIKGKALIQLRQVGTEEVFDYELDGENPAYVDMPVWFTHNIKNVGTEDLYTIFWINEFYDQNDPDTYFENV